MVRLAAVPVSTAVTFASVGTALVDLNAAGVQAGDYLEFNRGGYVYQIATVAANGTSLTLAYAGPTLTGTDNPNATTTEWRIRRQPVPLVGEDELSLPYGVIFDDGQYPAAPAAATYQNKCINLPVRTVGANNYYEIMFSPQGGVVGRGSGSDQITVLWLSNVNNPNVIPLLVAIQSHNGLIAVQQQTTTGTDPFANCRDPRASGL